MDRRAELDRFLAGVERRAFRMASLATRDREEALEIVQDAMMRLAGRYAGHDAAEWPLLFQRILHNRITDWQRRQGLRRRLFGFLPGMTTLAAERREDPLEAVRDPRDPGPHGRAEQAETTGRLLDALAGLPLRQRQAFLLRIWEGCDVADTAFAMGCSEGSVKTHLSRALARLRQAVGDEP